MRTFTPREGVPVRFLALRWSEDWEFGHPCVVLEPVVRYSPNGDSPEAMIEDLAIDIAIDWEADPPRLADEDVGREFSWRGWSLDQLRKAAAESLAGKDSPKKCYRAVEQHLVFRRDAEGILAFEEVKP